MLSWGPPSSQTATIIPPPLPRVFPNIQVEGPEDDLKFRLFSTNLALIYLHLSIETIL